MAKRATPKQQLCKSRGSRRYKAFQNKSRKKLMGKVDFMLKIEKQGKLKPAVKNVEEKVTKIKA
jgi:hypothetical protein